ncbi:MAG: SpoIIE family protein phosphatase [Anaerolineae bacterium]
MIEAVIAPHQWMGGNGELPRIVEEAHRVIAECCALAMLDARQSSTVQSTLEGLITSSFAQLTEHIGSRRVRLSSQLSLDAMRFLLHVDSSTVLTPLPPGIRAEVEDEGCTYHLEVPRYTSSISLREAERLSDHIANVVLPLGVALASETDFDRLLERILTEAKAICNADAGTLYLRKDEYLHFTIIMTDSLGIHLGGSSPKPVTFPSLSLRDAQGNPNTHNVATYVALTGHSINVPDMYRAEGFDFSAARRFDTQNNYRSVSNLTVPFKGSSGDVVGVLQLLNARDDSGAIVPFGKYDQLMVEILTGQAAIALNTRLLWEQQQQLIRIQSDMQVARLIQNNFIPSTLPIINGWELGGRFQPARDVSGDFYDAFTLSDGRVILMIGDVCDKGVGAALFMSLTRSLMRAFTTQAPTSSPFLDLEIDPAALRSQAILTAVANTNAYIAQHHEALNMFTTLFIGVIDPSQGLLTYVNGGHAPPLIIGRTGELKHRLKPTGPAVGMFGGSTYTSRELALEPGDILCCYTDGITDARAVDDAQFGEESLTSLLKSPCDTLEILLSHILSGVNQFIGEAVQFDDIAMVAIRRI